MGQTIALGLGLTLAILAGCTGQEGLERIPVSGRVTFDGKPVADGLIRFVPDPATSAHVTVERIQDGSYRTGAYAGVPVGRYRVEILGYNPQETVSLEAGNPPRVQILPPKYNLQSELEITVERGSPPVTRDFDLAP